VPLRVATFNAGLAVGVLPHSTERLPRVIESLAALDVDLLFVQEFWLDAHWERLRAALAPQLPHAFRAEPVHRAPHAPCTVDQVRPLVACAEARCAGLSDEALARCVVTHCSSTALALPTPCLNCLASHPVGTLSEILARCVGDESSRDAGPTPSTQGDRDRGLIAYGGSFGTGLLSRWPLDDVGVLVFDATVNARAALHGRMVTPSGAELLVFAVHFSPSGSERELQVELLLGWIEEKAGSAPALLLGDLNTTPGSRAFQRLEQAGFREPDPSDHRATYAADGLETGRVTESGWRLDHVLVRGLDAPVGTQRILDEPITIGVAGRRVKTTLSDHFGVLATIDAG
jgi:endonuclease/exonuclease/phosphatase family metal-dependent hydrolase